MATNLKKAIDDGELPRSYHDHPIVLGAPAGTAVHPIAIYVDGISFSRTDGCLAWWVYEILSGVRHLLCVLRRSEMRRCGCRGWCSIWQVWSFIHWSCACMARGVMPQCRHDGGAFRNGDTVRMQEAGKPLGWRACVLFIKGDWAEHVHSFGYPLWSTDGHPCPWCFATSDDIYAWRGMSPFGVPCRPKTIVDYENACRE
eukprot:9474064-Pyramimonas_sp.AAC.1